MSDYTKCEFCGLFNGAQWYDPCCERGLLKYREELAKCDTQFHDPNNLTRVLRCTKPANHEGSHHA